MKEIEFINILSRFKERPIPGRKMFLWHGREERLFEIINNLFPKDMIRIIKISENYQDEPNSFSDEGIRKYLLKEIKKDLKKLISTVAGRQVLIILDSYILARYSIPLTPLYEIYFSDNTFVIILVEKYRFRKELPSYAKYQPEATLKYLLHILPDEHKNNIINGEGIS